MWCRGQKDEGRLEGGHRCLWRHISITAVYNKSWKLLSVQNPLCRKLILSAFSVWLLKPYIQRRIIVFLNMQTSQSAVGAPWAEMMCKIAFLEACRLGEEASWNRHIISSTGRLFKWKISIYPVQEPSALNPILLGSCCDYWAGMVHTHIYTRPGRNTQTHSGQSWVIVLVK